MIVVNMFLVYLDKCKSAIPVRKSMIHMQFKTELYKVLLQNWNGRECSDLVATTRHWDLCFPIYPKKRNPCIVCNKAKTNSDKRVHYYRPSCNNKYISLINSTCSKSILIM